MAVQKGKLMGDSERWGEIPGWPYEVSDQGRVRRSEPGIGTFPGRILSPYVGVNGYEHVPLSGGGESERFRVHRLVLRVFEGPCPEGHEADHINGNRKDNRLENLRWLPRLKNCGAKLSERQVAEMRELYDARDVSYRDLAERYGVDETTVGNVIRGETWTDAGGPIKPASPLLTASEVLEIRRRYESENISEAELANEVGVSKSHAHRIVTYECWPDLKPADHPTPDKEG